MVQMSKGYLYPDRRAAGKKLAENIKPEINGNAIVLSLPRGGAVVGNEVAKLLNAEHDLVISRKIGAPYNPEVAIAAVNQNGELFKNEAVIEALAVTDGYLESQTKLQLDEIKRQLREFRGEKPFPNLFQKTVILVDDGLATGFTMEAAVEFVRSFKPSRIIVAVPVGSSEAIAKLTPQVDLVVCPLIPDKFWAVGQFYREFLQVSDAEVKSLFKDKEKP